MLLRCRSAVWNTAPPRWRPFPGFPKVFNSTAAPASAPPSHSSPLQRSQPISHPYENAAALANLSGGQIFHEMMLRHDVRHVFGYPGGAILPVFDAIHESPHFEFILPRHEQGAGHMAEAYARATGKPGVVLVTSGPGATNVITPMQDALSDGLPLVVFSGQVPTSAIGTDAFQEADVIGISRSCTKWNTMVKDIRELPRKINEAFAIATSGRPGPVLVDLPKDVTASLLISRSDVVGDDILLDPHIPGFKNLMSRDVSAELKQIASLISMAKRPIIYAGNGIINTHNGSRLLKELAEKANIPVTTTLQGLGGFDELHPLSLHMLGMHGSAYANLAMQSADLIIALGARFDDRVTLNLQRFAPAARKAELEGRGGIVQFEISPKNINKTVPVTVAVEGDVGPNIEDLLPQVNFEPREEWLAQLDSWKKAHPFKFAIGEDDSVPLKPQEVITEINRQLGESFAQDKVTITTGVGQHQMWAAQLLRWRHPRSFITSGGLGTMGFGLPAAIGAQIARPSHLVLDVDGDASFSMTGMELMTAVEFKVPVKVLILNNSFQGMVRQWQDLFYENRYSGTRMKNPDFKLFAESMGAGGMRLRKRSEMREVIRQFLFDEEMDEGRTRPVVLDCICDDREHVYPMVPAGKGLHEMVLGPDEVLT